MHVLRNIDRDQYRMDFLIHADKPGDYGEELKDMGCSLYHCCSPSRPLRYMRELKAILIKYGPYDVVHSHCVNWNGPVMSAAKQVGTPIRIVHSHNDMSQAMPSNFFQRLFALQSQKNSKVHATHGFACSEIAANSYFGPHWREDSRWKLLYYGVDFSIFGATTKKDVLRESFGLPKGAYVVGHVGSFRNSQKNHEFIIEIAREIQKKDPGIVFLFVGDGKFKSKIEVQAAQSGLKDNVFFTGVRTDVPQIMLGAMDLFLFPSLYEGLGLALVEAQAAGLPCICSDTIPKEADVISHLVQRISLSQSPEEWAQAIFHTKITNRIMKQSKALSIIEKSPFNIKNNIKALKAIYTENKSA
ncbi:glycosyltransferase [Candidatus Sumerlaeota bacterium]|nr:glycosyltransferase [Candidatus Sumerlaeota bacterium]